jgi:hypothetical protein
MGTLLYTYVDGAVNGKTEWKPTTSGELMMLFVDVLGENDFRSAGNMMPEFSAGTVSCRTVLQTSENAGNPHSTSRHVLKKETCREIYAIANDVLRRLVNCLTRRST